MPQIKPHSGQIEAARRACDETGLDFSGEEVERVAQWVLDGGFKPSPFDNAFYVAARECLTDGGLATLLGKRGNPSV